MKERPILFSGEMVRAILDGSKVRRKLYAPTGTDPLSPEHLALRLMNGIARITDTGCWEWGRSTSEGYGSLTVGSRTVRAHRLSLALSLGVDERAVVEAMHACDNRLCINPEHLSNGTHGDNVRDAIAKGRATPPVPPRQCGETNPASKLTSSSVTEIRQALGRGETQKKIAARYGVSQSVISNIALGKSWSHA